MATQTLNPELLKILKGLGQSGTYTDPATGMLYQGTFSGQGGGEDTGYLTGYTASGGPTDVETARADTFGLDGNKTGNISAYDPKGLMQAEDWMGVLAVLGATLGGGALASGMGLQGGAAASGLGGGSGAFLGEAPFTLSGAAPLDFGAASGMVGAAGGAGGSVAGPGMAGWGADLGVTSGGVGGGMGTTLTGSAGGALTAGGTGGGLLSGLGSLTSLAGPAATILGGAIGAKGNEATTNTKRTMDPRLDGPVYGPNGVVQMAQGLLAKQMAPEYQAGFDQMRNTGLGLLQQPIAGNGVGKVTLRK